MASSSITGGCACGAVRFSFLGPPITARVCWCRMCQYLGGGSGTVNVGLPTDGMVIEGEMATHETMADSGTLMQRSFCPKCGTPLMSGSEARAHVVFVRAGSLDDPNIAKPEATIWTKEAPDYACISDACPKVDRQPAPVPKPD